jgi:endonuclease III
MTVRADAAPTRYTPDLGRRLLSFVTMLAEQPDVKAAVEANHDDNRWWPVYVDDWRVRMTVAGWSARVSYAMIDTYADVVARADTLGWEALTALSDTSLSGVVQSIGLVSARVRYLRSLVGFINRANASGLELTAAHPDDLVAAVATGVHGAGYKTAQCAVLYAQGYHCGIIPVDSGMVSKLAPCLDIRLDAGGVAHEQLRKLLQACTAAHADGYRELAIRLGYSIRIPSAADPTWFVHLVLIYFKRFYLNSGRRRLCPSRPTCPDLFSCVCQPS